MSSRAFLDCAGPVPKLKGLGLWGEGGLLCVQIFVVVHETVKEIHGFFSEFFFGSLGLQKINFWGGFWVKQRSLILKKI